MDKKRRALVVGSLTEPLEGPEDDARGMKEALEKFGFDVDLRIGQDATQKRILEGYRKLIDDTKDGDAALFYYSGHGGLAANPDYRPGSKLPPYFQCIIPVDIEDTTESEFRGIMAEELSDLLAELTDKTANVTVVLDCCHAAQMSRDPLVRPKAFLQALRVGIAPHLERLVTEQKLRFDRLAPEGNPRAVRLVAAGVHQQAVEYETESGAFAGALTVALRRVLDEAAGARDLELTWVEIGNRVRERVLAIAPTQRPEVEGPCRRVLFDVRESERAGVLAVVPQTGRRVLLRGGRLLGLHAGDEYAILPAGVAAFRAKDCIATARVVEVRPGESDATLQYRAPHTEIPEGAQAFPRESAAPRRPIRIDAPDAERNEIVQAIAKAPLLRVTDVAADDESARLLATVRVADGRIELHDRTRALAVPAVPYSKQAVDDLVTNLWRMSAAQGLRELPSQPSDELPEEALEVEWGRVEDGQPVPLGPSGEVIPVGTRIYVKVRNTKPDRPLYVWIFGIDVAQTILLLSRSSPSGVRLSRDLTPEYVLGQRKQDQALAGQVLWWPDNVPDDDIRPEEMVVLAAEKPRELQVMESPGVVTRTAKGGSPLAQLLLSVQGKTRSVASEDEAEGYLVRRIDYQFSPKEATFPRGGEFLIDDRPPTSVVAFRTRGLDQPAPTGRPHAPRARPPRKLALTITELVVHDTLALFGSADVRVDAIAITPVAAGGRAPYQAGTRHFQRITDGERLPLDDVLIYHGDVRDFVDLRVWVSRDRQNSMDLADMLQERANSKDFAAAATTLLALTAVAPQAAVVVAAAGAAATLGKIAWELLSKALPKTIGVYQTSLLAADGFKVGRHPATGLFRAQGFSFGYEVKPVE